MNKQHEELLQEIVISVKETTGIDVEVGQDWIINMHKGLMDLLPVKYILDNGKELTLAFYNTNEEVSDLEVDSSIINFELERHELLYSTLLENFLKKAYISRNIVFNSLRSKEIPKELLEKTKIYTTRLLIDGINELVLTFMAVLYDSHYLGADLNIENEENKDE